MSEGPIKREREASRPPAVGKMPSKGDIVTIDLPPDGHPHWRIIVTPSSKLGPDDIITLESLKDGRRIRRHVHQTHAVTPGGSRG